MCESRKFSSGDIVLVTTSSKPSTSYRGVVERFRLSGDYTPATPKEDLQYDYIVGNLGNGTMMTVDEEQLELIDMAFSAHSLD
jgi:hypothetical protein